MKKIADKNQIKINIKKLAIFTTIVLIVLISLYLVVYHKLIADKKQYSQSISDKNFEKIDSILKNVENGTSVEKYFIAKQNKLEKMMIAFSKDESVVTAGIDVIIRLEDVTQNKIIKEDKVSYNMIRNNNNYDFIFDTQKQSKGKQYKLTIEFNKIERTNLTVKYNKDNFQDNTKIKVNGNEVTGTLGINEYYIASSKIMKFNIMSALLGGFILGLSILIYTRKNLTPEKLFMYTVPIICLMFMVVMPMYRGHDETRHLLRAYEISDGHLLTEIHNKKVGTPMPKSVIDGIGKNWREKLTYNDIMKLKNKTLRQEEIKTTNMETVAVYSPVQYLPQSLGMIIARVFTDNLLFMLYMARLFNLIVCIILLYFVIKIIPFGKMLVFIIALIPLSIEAFATMSPDGITISVAMLFVSYILNIIFTKDKIVNKKDIAILSILSIIIALCKIVYVPLVGLILIIPSSKYKSKKQKVIVSTLMIFVSIVINLIWLKISGNYLGAASGGTATEKVKNVLMSPIGYLRTLLYTMNYSGNQYMQTLFGSVLAMGEFVKLYFVVPFVYSILFLFEAATDSELKNRFNLFQNIIMLLIVIAIVGLIFTSLYVQYTDLNSMVIQGVQGRYFIPIMLLVGLLLGNLKITNSYKTENKIKAYGIVTLVLQMYIMLSIIVTHM